MKWPASSKRSGRLWQDRFKPGMRVVAANSAPCDECFFCRKGRANLCEDLVFNNGAYAEYALDPRPHSARKRD